LKDLFISHSHADKTFVRQLASDCEANNLTVWVDEAELLIGDSLIQTIQNAIDSTKFFLVVISVNSVDSNWVQRELEQAMEMELSSKTVKVLPLVLGQINELPGFLRGKLFADFSNWPGDTSQYLKSVGQLVRSVSVRSKSDDSPDRPVEPNHTGNQVVAPKSPTALRLKWAAVAALVFAAILLVGVTTMWISWTDAAAYWLVFAVIEAIALALTRKLR
jgi:hypothetical protein